MSEGNLRLDGVKNVGLLDASKDNVDACDIGLDKVRCSGQDIRLERLGITVESDV